MTITAKEFPEMNKIEALKYIEVFCRKTFSQSNYSEWQIKTEDGFSYLQGTLHMFSQCLVQCQYRVWVEFQNKYSKKLIVTVEACLTLEHNSVPYLSWVEIKSNKKKIQGDGKHLDILLPETKKIIKPILDFIENEIQVKIDLSKKVKKDSCLQLTIDFIKTKI
jgi:uncharacterized protein YbaP (TraB family)